MEPAQPTVFRATDYLRFPPSISARVPITPALYARHVLPVYLTYYIMAVLVCLPNTRPLRMLLLPVFLGLAWISATAFDISLGEAKHRTGTYGNVLIMFMLSMRVTDWAFTTRPLQRVRQSDQASASAWGDALDLICNLRGVGWTWSRGNHLPSNPYARSSRTHFLAVTIAYGLYVAFMGDAAHYMIQSFDPDGFGSPAGGSIFDPALPPVQRYARSSFITFLAAACVFFAMETYYALAAGFGTAVLRTSPAAWPPLTARPWAATSLEQFWGRGWHQTFRRPFARLGALFRGVFGPAGAIIGAFAASGVLHDVTCWGMDHGLATLRIQGFFFAMAVGCVLERVWTRVTGKKVAGFAGWVWTMAWIIGWGNNMAEAAALMGLAGMEFVLEPFRMGKMFVQVTRSLLTGVRA